MLMECLWAKTVTYGHRLALSLSVSLSLRYAHICTQLLVSSTDEFWENKQLQEEERTIRLDGLPNFIIYYGLPEMHTLLQPGACLRFTCNRKPVCAPHYMHAHMHTSTIKPSEFQTPKPYRTMTWEAKLNLHAVTFFWLNKLLLCGMHCLFQHYHY